MNTSVTTASTSSNEAGLILPDKENNPLPTINHAQLVDPQYVVDRNFKLLRKQTSLDWQYDLPRKHILGLM